MRGVVDEPAGKIENVLWAAAVRRDRSHRFSQWYERPVQQIDTRAAQYDWEYSFPVSDGGFWLGTDPEGHPVGVTDEQLTAHLLAVGRAGAGQTTLFSTLLEECVRAELPCLVFEFKNITGSRQWCVTCPHITYTAVWIAESVWGFGCIERCSTGVSSTIRAGARGRKRSIRRWVGPGRLRLTTSLLPATSPTPPTDTDRVGHRPLAVDSGVSSASAVTRGTAGWIMMGVPRRGSRGGARGRQNTVYTGST